MTSRTGHPPSASSKLLRLASAVSVIACVNFSLASAALAQTADSAKMPLMRDASAVGLAPADTVYVTKTGVKYHQARCRFLSKSSIPILLGEAVKTRTPCSRCFRLGQGAGAAIPVPRNSSAQAAPQPHASQCAAITKKGKRCSRRAQPGSEYCWRHGR